MNNADIRQESGRNTNGCRKAAARSAMAGAAARWLLPAHDQVGLKPIEFEKEKSAIVVPPQDKLPTIIDTLITAIRNGELDEQLAQGSKQAAAKTLKAA